MSTYKTEAISYGITAVVTAIVTAISIAIVIYAPYSDWSSMLIAFAFFTGLATIATGGQSILFGLSYRDSQHIYSTYRPTGIIVDSFLLPNN